MPPDMVALVGALVLCAMMLWLVRSLFGLVLAPARGLFPARRTRLLSPPMVLLLVLAGVLAYGRWPDGAGTQAPPSAGTGAAAPVPATAAGRRVAADWRTRATSTAVSDAVLAAAAEACARQALAAARDDCAGGPPIFVVGRDVPQVARFDEAALTAHPQWHRLTRDANGASHTALGVRRDWYRAYAEQCGRDVRTTTTLPADCQEFPFWSTLEGGPEHVWAAPPALVGLVNGSENAAEGSKLRWFFERCRVTAAPAGSTPGVPAPATFIVVATMAVPSFSVC
jgi:hypothetical protein